MAMLFQSCAVVGCNRNAHRSANGTRGWCCTHYERWRAHGDPLGGGTIRGEPERHYRAVVVPYDRDDCLIWPFARNARGYAHMYRNGKTVTVSRLVCEAEHGPAKPGQEAAHLCGRGHEGCVTRRHLVWKTRTENMADKIAHGTHNRGARSARAKLTEDQVREIRRIGNSRPRTELAKAFGVNPEAIGKIVLGQRWTDVT